MPLLLTRAVERCISHLLTPASRLHLGGNRCTYRTGSSTPGVVRGRGRRGRRGRGGLPEEGRRHDAGEAGGDGRPRVGVHLRGPDAQLPRRQRHERPPPRRSPRGGARRPMGRRALRQRRAVRPGAGVRRRWLERARSQRHQHGARHRARRIRWSSAGCARCLPRRTAAWWSRPGSPGFLSVVLASLAFTLEYAVGGAGGVSLSTVIAAMVGVHVLIGIGEGVITAATVARGARGPARRRVRRGRPRAGTRVRAGWSTTSGEAACDEGTEASYRDGLVRRWVRSSSRSCSQRSRARSRATRPTGSTRSPSTRASPTRRGSVVADSPLAGYAVKDVENEKVSKGLSGSRRGGDHALRSRAPLSALCGWSPGAATRQR